MCLVRRQYLGAGLLDPLGERLDLGVVGELDGGLALAEQRDDGDARVAADDGDADTLRVHAIDLADEGGRAHHVQRRHAQHAVGVVHSCLDITNWFSGRP